MTIDYTTVSSTCTSCGGNGWLPTQAAGLTLTGWSSTLCRECGGSGVAGAEEREAELKLACA
jgi:DnaJ-class molecular chaperone